MSIPKLAVGALALCVLWACDNNPYPSAESDQKIYYTRFATPLKTLDPAVSYTTIEHAILGNVYDGLLQYHYLKRPFELIPALAERVPEPETDAEGRVRYRFRIRPGALYHPDPCFAAYHGEGTETRAVVASDFAFELARVADPSVGSPVVTTFNRIEGFEAFSERLVARRESDPAFAALPAHEQYAAVGPIEGVRVLGEHELELVLGQSYPQILYWLAMGFTAAVPWEAVDYYDGETRPHFRDHPVGSGPYRLTRYDKQARMVLERFDQWYGRMPEHAGAPGTVYPSEGAPGDAEQGLLSEARVGRTLPRIERVEFYREKEAIPGFGKFMQGYYDSSGIIKESFDSVITGDRLSDEMAARGLRLERSVEPSIYYLGFNMEDDVVGSAAGERGRKLRQAMSLVVDVEEYLRLFTNGRGVPAQSPIPPGLFGYREEYRNPFREVNRERAMQLLAEAGYEGGIDPETGQPLRLGFDAGNTTVQALLQYQFFVDAWRSLGIDVEIRATDYSQFQDKVRNGAYQIFQWGWFADYPDPENFLFLLETSVGRVRSGGPNTANFSDPEYDALFEEMKARPNDAERQRIIDEMVALLERERPWIELYHSEAYGLYQPWLAEAKPFGMSYPMHKYLDLDPELRVALREDWNEPVRWPAYALAGLWLALLIPGVVTYARERT